MFDYEKQANDFLEATGTDFKVVGYRGCMCMPHTDGMKMDKWGVKLRRNGKEWRFDFYMGLGHGGAEPTAYDVLASIEKYDVGSFEDFCNEFGYDMLDDETGRRNANSYGLYKAVCREYKHVIDMFYDCLDELCEIA